METPHSPDTRIDITRPISQAILAPLALMVVFCIVLSWQMQRLPEVRELVDHTNEVISEARQVQRLHFAASAELRGYLITRSDEFRRSLDVRVQAIEAELPKLVAMVTDNDEQLSRGRTIENHSAAWLAYARSSLDKDAPSQAGLDAARVKAGKQIIDSIDSALDAFVAHEENLLQLRVGEVQQASWVIAVSSVVMSLLIGIALAILGFRTLRSVALRYDHSLQLVQQTEHKLREANEHLEERVLERTRALEASNAALTEEIATRKEAERQLIETATQLKRSNRELEDFAYVASHDLQEPLRKIRAFGDRLQSQHAAHLNDQANDYLVRMLSAARRMQTLIQDLLSFSRLSTRAQPFQPTNLNAVVRDVMSDLETRIDETAGQVTIGDLPEIEGDPMQMRQLFQNLIANALKFHKPGSPPIVHVDARNSEQEGCVELRVRDEGIGFDERYLTRLFTPFQRLHGRNEYEGTGIGLAVCRKIAERHGGNIDARSEPGAGATFLVTLPLRQLGDPSDTALSNTNQPVENNA